MSMSGKPYKPFVSAQPSRTVQSFRQETDLGKRITSMMRGVRKDPRIPSPGRPGLYSGPGSVPDHLMDWTGAPKDFHELQNKVIAGRHFFDSLPLEVKVYFGQDPEPFFLALQDPAQGPLLVSLGILKAPPPPPKPEVSTAKPSQAGDPDKGAPRAPESGK